MTWKIRKCKIDGTYTLRERCPKCNSFTIIPHPARFSPVDKYVSYRILLKKGIKC
ncbi:MAG: RNA-protein complex protein Nop10 [Sulfolobaceae archaeon]